MPAVSSRCYCDQGPANTRLETPYYPENPSMFLTIRPFLLVILLASLGLAGCGLELNPPKPVAEYRSLDTDRALGWIGLSTPIAGLSYQSDGESGVTDDYGLFSYPQGGEVRFYLGQIQIGAVAGAAIITPLELVGANDASDVRAINLTRLLMALDEDQDTGNGISIISAAAQLSGELNLGDPASLDTVLAQADPDRALADAASAQAQLEQILAEIKLAHIGDYRGEWFNDSPAGCDFEGDFSLSLTQDANGLYSITGALSRNGVDETISGQLDGHSSFSARIDSLALELSGDFANGIVRGSWRSSDGLCQGRFQARMRQTQYRDDASIRSSAFERFYLSQLDGSETIYFGAIEPDQTVARTFELVNDTGSDFSFNLGAQQGQLSNGFAYTYACDTLAPDEACLVILLFLYQNEEQPDAIEEGEKTATLEIRPADPDQANLVFNLSATVKSNTGQPLLIVTPDLIGFSQSTAGVASPPQRLFVANAGPRPLYLLPVLSNQSAFTISESEPDACSNRLLKIRQHCYIDIIFTPAASAEDRFTVGTLILRSDDPERRTAGITLEGYTGTDIRCFIATAAYGSYLDPHVDSLRRFRDQYLLSNRIPGGAWLVDWYYRHSPALAAVISEHASLRLLTRAVLTPIVFTIEYPLATLLLISLLVVGWRWPRLRRGLHRAR